MVDIKSICHLTILLLSFCFMLVHCSLEPTDQFLDNPTDVKQDVLTMHKRPSFFVGSRYGRSSGGASSSSVASGAYAPSKTRRLNVVPRNDRFFLGSRYGKRAEISTGTQLSNKPAPSAAAKPMMLINNPDYNGDDEPASGGSTTPYMSCVYTGLQNFYRCNSIDDNMFYVKNTVKNDAAYQNNFNNNYDDDDDGDVDDADDEENKIDDVNSAVYNDDDAGDGEGIVGSNVGDIHEVLSTDATQAADDGVGAADEDLVLLFNEAGGAHTNVNGKN
ncbi:RYamide isoform X2 [Musca autumnalis]|uniref:RYamide isoform X2 n=1 Tax=Musca autumnalis TaxID=221902 RepID=UPI003CF569DF